MISAPAAPSQNGAHSDVLDTPVLIGQQMHMFQLQACTDCRVLLCLGGSNPCSEPTSPRSSYGWGLPDVPSMGEQHTEESLEMPGSPTRSGGSFSGRKGVSHLARAVTGERLQVSWPSCGLLAPMQGYPSCGLLVEGVLMHG
jgi:hypothetical protein